MIDNIIDSIIIFDKSRWKQAEKNWHSYVGYYHLSNGS